MFEIGKKGSEKREEPMARDERTSTNSSIAESVIRKTSSSEGTAVIGPSIRIDGDLRGDENLRIEGEVKGTVQLKNNNLVIGSEGRVRATVYAHSVDVEGLMEGDLFGAERVTIRKSAKVRGNITAPRVSLEDGAQFKGSIEMDQQAVETALGKGRANVSPLPGGQQAPSPQKAAGEGQSGK
jgi:cytoskeletal protein CcmA (bactofilin family)